MGGPLSVGDEQPVLSLDYVQRLQSQQLSWEASADSPLAGKSIADMKKMLNCSRYKMPMMRLKSQLSDSDAVPASFDSRVQWPHCSTIKNILNQGQCGSCWAFGASESLSDRLCIASGGSVDVQLSPQELVSCDWEGNEGCNGGIPQLAWEYEELAGLPSLQCVPYTSGNGTKGSCPHSCVDGSSFKRYKAKPLTLRTFDTVAHIQEAIQAHGPVEGTMSVYQSFIAYKSGVYQKTANDKYLGGHAIKILGWGTDTQSGLPYWLVANSWGTDWGLDGFFWIRRGDDQCGIDRDASAAQADV